VQGFKAGSGISGRYWGWRWDYVRLVQVRSLYVRVDYKGLLLIEIFRVLLGWSFRFCCFNFICFITLFFSSFAECNMFSRLFEFVDLYLIGNECVVFVLRDYVLGFFNALVNLVLAIENGLFGCI